MKSTTNANNLHLINQSKMTVAEINKLIQELPSEERGKVSDTYHTIDELYTFRKVYNAALFNQWALLLETIPGQFDINGMNPIRVKYDVHKSWRHHDGELCFGGDWFIVVAILPTGQISNHYHASDWELFRIPEVEKAKYEWDGHDSSTVLSRLKSL